MKAIQSLFLAAALTAVGFAATLEVQAATGHGGGGGARVSGSGGHWSGGHGGGHWGGGRWHGGYRYWGPSLGFYVGAPLLWSSWYWGYPYDYYYPRSVVIDRVIERYPQSFPEGVMEAPATTVVPRSPGAPSEGPAYLNFCASANAYYPKVTACPEGWKFLPTR